jgi:hypothetical protein|nr:hypothetical protein [Acutalibacter muris]
MIQIDMVIPSCQPDAHHLFYTCGVTDEDVMDSEHESILEQRPLWCRIKEVGKSI